MADANAQARYRANLQGEVDSALLYRTLASLEKNPQLAAVYGRLAAIEEAHAEFWRNHLHTGAAAPRTNLRTRMLIWLARRFGAAFVLPTIRNLERLDSGLYDTQQEAVAAGLPEVERSHARIIASLADAAPDGISGASLARLEGRHRGMGGNALRAAVLGANDGLVSNLSLVMGVAGAVADARTVLITGLAGLLAGAGSMAMGEWLSVNSARESYQRQIEAERIELEQMPEEEKEELVLIYQAKGLPAEQAQALAERLIANHSTALDTLAREELGIDPDDLGGSPWTAALSSSALFAFGAIFPVLPFFLLDGDAAIVGGVVLSGFALFLIGAGTTFFTGRGLWFSGLRQLAIGYAAAALTYGIGRLIGVAIIG